MLCFAGDFVLVEKEKETKTIKKSFQQPKATFSYKVNWGL